MMPGSRLTSLRQDRTLATTLSVGASQNKRGAEVSDRNKAIIIGGLVGAALGITAAWAYAKVQEEKLAPQLADGRELRLQAGAPEYVRIGIALLALIRLVTELFKPV
jgi:hypothetical protein